MPVRYSPILRWKRGERVGLTNLSAAGRLNVFPLVVVAADQFRAKQPTVSRPAVTAADNFVNELMTAWASAPIYIDAAAVPHAIGASPIVDIAMSAHTKGARIIPATSLDAPPAYQAAVQTIVQRQNKGVGLRVDIQEFANTANWVANWPFPQAQTDLIVDLADNVALVQGLGAVVDNAFTQLHRGQHWRSVTVAGSNMPGNFGGYTQGLHLLPRRELQLWQHLSSLPLPYALQFGDYTSVSPNAPPQGIAWGFPINVRYSLSQDFLICRGVGTTGFGGVDMDQQLLGHAQSIVAYPNRGALPHCWADTRINNIAGGASPGNLESWVQIGVNRHIELTRQILP
jgi:T4 beta protein